MNVQLFVFLFLLLLLLIFIIFCCVIVGSDPTERFFSDREQMEYISEWRKKHPKECERKQK